MSTDVWPQLSDAPAGLTDSRGGVNEASPPSSQKDALLSSKPNKSPPPSSPSNQGQKEVSKVSESAQEALSPTPQKAAPKEQSKTEAPRKKKDPVGENGKAQLSIRLHHCPHLSLSNHALPPCSFLTVGSESHISFIHSTCFHLTRYESHYAGLPFCIGS